MPIVEKRLQANVMRMQQKNPKIVTEVTFVQTIVAANVNQTPAIATKAANPTLLQEKIQVQTATVMITPPTNATSIIMPITVHVLLNPNQTQIMIVKQMNMKRINTILKSQIQHQMTPIMTAITIAVVIVTAQV